MGHWRKSYFCVGQWDTLARGTLSAAFATVELFEQCPTTVPPWDSHIDCELRDTGKWDSRRKVKGREKDLVFHARGFELPVAVDIHIFQKCRVESVGFEALDVRLDERI